MKINYFVNVAMEDPPPPGGGGRDRRAAGVRRSPRAHLTSDMVGYHGKGGSVRPSGTLDHAWLLGNESVTAF